jgi:hypothetical protein
MDGLSHDDQREENGTGDSDEESDSEMEDDLDEEDVDPNSQGALAEELKLPTPVFASDDEEMEDCEEDSDEWEGDFDEDFDEWEENFDESDDKGLTGASRDIEAIEEEEMNLRHNGSL